VLDDGTRIEVDDFVFATGFDALTGPLLTMDVTGTGGRLLRDDWAYGPVTYLGLGVHGYPNLFLLGGPGAPTPLSNSIVTIETQVEWIGRAIQALDPRGAYVFNVDAQAQQQWVDHCNEVVADTLFTRARSWYTGANIPGKPTVFMAYAGGLPRYRQFLADESDQGYPRSVAAAEAVR
jgi:cyclohexanone monooxygenase